jgi:kynurenine 3-monooxygenase
MKNLSIIGAGPCGCLLSIYLARRGYNINLYERRPDMRSAQFAEGRSINLAISARGLLALEQAGMKELIIANAVAIKGRAVHIKDGSPEKYYLYGRNQQEINYSISRKLLNSLLLGEAEQYNNITIHFEHKITGVDIKASTISALNNNSLQLEVIKFDQLIATDGAGSAVRDSLNQLQIIDFDNKLLNVGYKEILLPSTNASSLKPEYLHIWPRKEFMLMGLANLDHSFTLTLFAPLKGETGLKNLTEEHAVSQFFLQNFPELSKMIPNLTKVFLQNPTANLFTVQGKPWYFEDKILLIGDAAHTIVPFFGQGINCGFEDCRLFNQMLDDKENVGKQLFRNFYQKRKANTDAIAEMAFQNYDEMRKGVSDVDYSFYYYIERELMSRFPDQYVSRYILVSYTHCPYSFAHEAGKLQKALLNEIYSQSISNKEINWQIVANLVDHYSKQIAIVTRHTF